MGLMQLLLPDACAGCGRYGDLLCAACEHGLRPATADADRFAAADPGIVVGDALELAMAAFLHEGTTRRVLQRLKYGGAGRLAVPLATAAAPALQALVAQSGPAPLVPGAGARSSAASARDTTRRSCWRSRWAGSAGLPVLDLLQRHRPTVRQHGLGRAARLHNLRGAIGPAAAAPRARGRDPRRRHPHHLSHAGGVRRGAPPAWRRARLRLRRGPGGVVGQPDGMVLP